MAEITAKLVNELRSKTGQPMMEYKKALTETNGDMEGAVEYFRKKGIKTSIMERAAGEGRVIGLASPDGKSAALVEVNCNTDFTAKSEPVQQAAILAAKLLLADPKADVANAPQVQQVLTATAQQTGENVRLGRTAVLSNANGKVGVYIYSVTNKIGVLVSVTGNPSDDVLLSLGMHLSAKKPVALSLKREGLPPELVEKERQIGGEAFALEG